MGVHESMCLFESVRFEKCPCKKGLGFVIGGEFVGVQLGEKVNDEVEFVKVEEEEEESVDGFERGSDAKFEGSLE